MKPDPIEADIRARMAADGSPPLVIDAFLQSLRRWNDGDLGVIPGSSLAPLGNPPPHGDPEHMRPGDPQAGHEPGGVVREHGDRVFSLRHVGQAGPAVVEEYEPKTSLEFLNQGFPPRQIPGKAHDQDEGWAIPDDPVVHPQIAHPAKRHGAASFS